MRKNVFSSSIKILIVSLLLLAVFFQKERSQKLMALALILWIAVTAGIFLFRKSGKLAKKCRAFSASLKQAGRTAKAPAEKTAEPVPRADTEPAEPAAPAKPAPDSRETETMLLHVSLRITEKLKSAYPQSVWQWKDTPSLQGILAGGTVRILVENMDAYTHADISFDRFGRIHVEPMTIGSFAEPSGNGTSAGPGTGDADAAEEMPPEPSVVDVRVWYECWERNEAAITATAEKYGSYCHTISYNILHSNEDAEECVNDTWLRAWKSLPPQRPNRLSTYLGKIIRNLSLDRFKQYNAEKRGRRQTGLMLSELEDCIPAETDVEQSVDEMVLVESLNQFLYAQPEQKRNIFIRRYWYLYPIRDIAEAYGISENKTTSLLFRMRNELKTHLEKEGIML